MVPPESDNHAIVMVLLRSIRGLPGCQGEGLVAGLELGGRCWVGRTAASLGDGMQLCQALEQAADSFMASAFSHNLRVWKLLSCGGHGNIVVTCGKEYAHNLDFYTRQ